MRVRISGVKTFLKILGVGLAAFMTLAIAQEWQYFSATWFGRSAPAEAVSDEDLDAAAGTVREVLVMMEHLYGTGGDPRFAERMPVSRTVMDRMLADVEYLRRNHRRQEPRLQKLEISAAESLGPGRVEIRTREYWIHRIFWLVGDGAEAEPPHSQVITAKYLLSKGPQGWRVDAWSFDDDPPSPPQADEP
jgi:hypothetical protein